MLKCTAQQTIFCTIYTYITYIFMVYMARKETTTNAEEIYCERIEMQQIAENLLSTPKCTS